METRDIIIKKAKHLFATRGYEGISMRELAASCHITLSNTYHYFPSKDALLEVIFHETNTGLGKKRLALPALESASDLLKQRIEFQFDNAEDIVYVLKYYLTFRKRFKKTDTGFLPPKSYLHIEEVLSYGVKTGEFSVKDIYADAQVIAHCINGFVLEYFPHKLPTDDKKLLVNKIHHLLLRALTNHGE